MPCRSRGRRRGPTAGLGPLPLPLPLPPLLPLPLLLLLLLLLGVPASGVARSPSGGVHFAPPAGAGSSSKFLVASFPPLKQVAYVHLPDNVWRPLVIGEVARPEAIAVDPQNARLFVADPPNGVVWWYKLGVRHGSLLQTVGPRHAAVENFNASWLVTNSVGDLFLAGHRVGTSAAVPYRSIFRQDAIDLATGDSLHPAEVLSRSNTGTPNPKAWEPSGLAVDSFFLYWGNGRGGTSHGSVLKASSDGHGVLREVSDAVEEVSAVCVTGTHVFFLSPGGVYGASKSTPTTAHDPSEGLIATAPASSSSWSPSDMAWDGENTLYVTDSAGGALYSLPAQNVLSHNLTTFVDSPNVHGVAVISFHSSTPRGPAARSLGAAAALAAAAAWLSASRA